MLSVEISLQQVLRSLIGTLQKKSSFKMGLKPRTLLNEPRHEPPSCSSSPSPRMTRWLWQKKISKLCLASSKAHFQICQNYFFEKKLFYVKKIYFLISFNERWWFFSWTAAKCSISRGSGFKSLLFSLFLSLYLSLSYSISQKCVLKQVTLKRWANPWPFFINFCLSV